MPIRPQKLLHGTLDVLILRAVAKGELHGLAISRRIEQMTHGAFAVKPGSLFPALHRLEQAGSLVSFEGPSDTNRRAKYYKLTKSGEDRLKIEIEEWERIATAMSHALRST